MPCLYGSCPCTFKTQSALRTHLSRYHTAEESSRPGSCTILKCLVCNGSCPNEKDYFQHIGNHLKSHETVFCVFEGCDFRTNIYNTFLKHKSRRHKSYSFSDFKQSVLDSHHNQTVSHSDVLETNYVEDTSLDCDPGDASDIVVQRIGLLLLKLESV